MGQIVARRTGLSQRETEKRVADVYAKAQARVQNAEVGSMACMPISDSAPLFMTLRSAEVKRQTNAAITKVTRENLKALTQEAKPPALRAKRKR